MKSLAEILEKMPAPVAETASVGEALARAGEAGIVPVADAGGRVIGAVARGDDVSDLLACRAELTEVNRWKHTVETVLDAAYEGIVVVDERGTIVMFNRAYGEFLNVDPAAMIGRDVREAIENTRMHLVVQTGEPEIRQMQRIKGHDMVCDRIPIREGDRVVGAVGKVLFRDVSEIEEILAHSRQLKSELEHYKSELKRRNGTRYSLSSIVGGSPQLQHLKGLARQVARSNAAVLIGGESGAGKELFAHAIHNAGPRAPRPFVKVNCAALPEHLLEAELFGHADASAAGGRRGGKVGKFETAAGGTLFLDEVSDVPPSLQVKLLRAVHEREVERIGDPRPIPVDVRVIAATNRNLLRMVEERQFRADLYYRLNVIPFDVPPLRERRQDIPALAAHFLAHHCEELGCEEKSLSPEALHALAVYRWPGNVRELENALERAAALCDGHEITPAHLPLVIRSAQERREGLIPLKRLIDEVEAEHLREALSAAGGNAVRAAELLGIGKTSFYDKLAKHKIDTRRF